MFSKLSQFTAKHSSVSMGRIVRQHPLVTFQRQAVRRFASNAQPINIRTRIISAYEGVAPGMSSTQKAAWTLAGAAALIGIGTMAQPGSVKESYEDGVLSFFPDYVRERLNRTYGHLLVGISLTAGSATLAYRTGMAHRIIAMNPWLFMGASVVGTIGTMALTHSFSIVDQPVPKYLAWGAFNGLMGLTISTVGFVGAPILLKAAAGTCVMVGSLSLVAMNAPSEQFLWMRGPLTIGLGCLLGASIGQLFFPASTMLQNVVLYGGLAYFGSHVLYDTQLILKSAKSDQHYDPINNSIGIYVDSVNIFIRLVQIFMGSNKK